MACVLLIGGYVLLKPPYDRAWYMVNKSTCQTHLKDMGLALKLYARDANDALPPVFSGPEQVGWAGAVQPYVKTSISGPFISSWPFECPFDATRRSSSPSQSGFSDYWYNANVMRKTPRGVAVVRLAQLKAPGQTILVGCGGSMAPGGGFDATHNQCGDGTSLTSASQTCAPSPWGLAVFPNQPIHYGGFGTNLQFADGHVKWFRAGTATVSPQVNNNSMTLKTVGGQATFSLLER